MTQKIINTPEVILSSIYGFLDHEDVLNSALVCKIWNQSELLKQARDRSKREAPLEYPIELRRIFQENHTPIDQLPVLDLTSLWEPHDYIDFLKPKDVTHPVMRFKDPWGRRGVVLHICHRKRGSGLPFAHKITKDSGLPFVIFQRYTNNRDTWMYACLDNDYEKIQISNKYKADWNAEMPDNGAALARISKLLAGKDAEFYVSPPRWPSWQGALIVPVAAFAAFINAYNAYLECQSS